MTISHATTTRRAALKGSLAVVGLAAVGAATPATAQQTQPYKATKPSHRQALDQLVTLEQARRKAAETAIAISHPMNPDGTRSLSLTRLGNRLELDATTPASRKHRLEAIKVAKEAGNAYPPKDEATWYAHCSRWVGPIINTSIDPKFPANWTKMQIAYVQDSANGWVRMGTYLPYIAPGDRRMYRPDRIMRPGDVILTDEWSPSGHVLMWVGNHGGYSDVVTEAAWGGYASPGVVHPASKLGGLRRMGDYLDAQGRDSHGRQFSTWRYYGPEVAQRVATGGRIRTLGVG